ncbi:hypothetical protein MSAN_02377400 [Mycena sanguinolenta]|uniref:Uncharacterized protein n=1 Tax=Mycena sanguinolenta TaxID=230812 RepID=A0A8H6X538_9AGAR|nr:hypothetical protein MSAN_02377400 [Mycena sanguinolenta]
MEGEEALVEKAPQAQETSDFRTIQRGDLKLVGKEVVAGRLSRRVGVRQTVYHAEIRGDPGTVTVAIYQGDGAKEDWRKHVAKIRIDLASQYHAALRIAHISLVIVLRNLWRHAAIFTISWIRYDAGEAYTLRLESRPSFWEHGITKAWLAQANRIFAELEEAYVEDCICVYSVQFALRCVVKLITAVGRMIPQF